MPAPIVAAASRAAVSAATRTVAVEASEAAMTRAAARAATRAATAPAAHGPGPIRRLFSSIWEIRGWGEILSGLAPTVQHKITVRAQGAKDAPLNDVVHLALAAAFGCITNDKWAKSAIMVGVSHTRNSVEISYTYQTYFFPAVLKASADFLKNRQKTARLITHVGSFNPIVGAFPGPTQNAIVGGVEGAEQGGSMFGIGNVIIGAIGGLIRGGPGSAIGGAAKTNWSADGGVKDVTATGTPPAIAENPIHFPDTVEPKTKRELTAFEQLNQATFEAMGGSAIYHLGRETIVGGVPPPHMDSPDDRDRPAPFRDMVGKTILTRRPALNPQPPAALGNDLRSLVAQVLHDPGVRPPLAATDAGAPTVAVEELGR